MKGLVKDANDISTAKTEVTLAADTATEVLSITMPVKATIKKITAAFANVVDAKAISGYLELTTNRQTGPWRFPLGFGTGGAATLTVQNRAEIPVNIPVEQNEKVTINVTMNDECVSAFCGIEYDEGGGGGPITYADCNVAEDAAISADTLTDFASITIPPQRGGRIKKVLVSFGNIVNAKAASGYVGITGTVLKGPHQYVIGGGSGGATNAGGFLNAIEIPVDIPVADNEVITPKLYIAEAGVDGHVGIMWIR